MSLTLHVWRVVVFLYAGSRCLLHNLTDMRRKPSVHFGIRVAMVPESYQRSVSIKVTGDTRLTLEGCDAFRVVVTSCGESGGGGVMPFSASMFMTVRNLFRLCLIHGSGGLCLLVEPLLHLLGPFIIHGKRVDDFQRLSWRGNRG
jgi:hypothetical protein